MKCPFGYDDHRVTWRCYVAYAADWLFGVIPESWPHWVSRPLMWIMLAVEQELPSQEPKP